MLTRILNQARVVLSNIENNMFLLFGRRYPPDGFCLAGLETPKIQPPTNSSFSLDELLKDSILWAVPKHRRTLEKRMNRKYGWPDQVWKLIVPKKNLLMCKSCGNHHQAGYLCPNCYSKVIKETKEMQAAIEEQLGFDPIEKEVVVLYQGEKEGETEEFYKGKRIIEMKKERPQWYSKNLLEKTTQAPSTSTSLKPTDLA